MKTYEQIPTRFAAAQFDGERITEDLSKIIGDRKATISDGVLTITAERYPRTLRVVRREWVIKVTRAGEDEDEEGRIFSLNDAAFKAAYREVSGT